MPNGIIAAGIIGPILIVQHIGAFQSMLPTILNHVDGDKAA